MPPAPPERQKACDQQSNGKRDVDEPESVENPCHCGERSGPNIDHPSKKPVVDALDLCARAVQRHQHEDGGCGRRDEQGDRDVAARHREERVFESARLGYPGHDAPAPHNARSSCSATNFTRAARGVELRALSAANTTVAAPPGEDRSYVTQPPGKT